jgi:hypothetical protein
VVKLGVSKLPQAIRKLETATIVTGEKKRQVILCYLMKRCKASDP